MLLVMSLFFSACQQNKQPEVKPELQTELYKTVKYDTLFCLISNLDSTTHLASMSPIKLLHGNKEGGISIVKESGKIVRSYSDTLKVTLQTYSHDEEGNYRFNQKFSLREFQGICKSETNARWQKTPFRAVLMNDVIIEIREIYIP